MPSISEQIPDISGIINLATTESGKLTGIVNSLSDFPFNDIQGMAGNLVSVALPDIAPVLDKLPMNMDELISKIKSGPTALLGELGGALDGIKDLFGEQFLGILSPVLEKLESLKGLAALETFIKEPIEKFKPVLEQLTDFDALGSGEPKKLFDKLAGLMETFPSLEEIPFFGNLKKILDTLKSWKDFSPGRLGSWVSEIMAGLYEGLNTLNSSLQEEVSRIGTASAIEVPAEVGAGLQQVRALLNDLQGMDFSQSGTLETAAATATELKTALDNYVSQLTSAINQVSAVMQTFNPDVLLDKLYALYFALQEMDGSAVKENPVERFLESIGRGIRQFDDEKLMNPVRETLDYLTGFFDNLDLKRVREPIRQVAEKITSAANELENIQTRVVMNIKALFDEARQVIDSIDTEALAQAFQGFLEKFGQQLQPVRDALDALKNAINNIIGTLAQSLDGLDLDGLLGELEKALNQVRDLLKNPAVTSVLNGIKGNIESMMGQLQSITFDPIIDQVIEEVDGMRRDLAGIDVSSLNQILRMALKAALEVVKAINFKEEIIDPLTGEFKEIVDVPQGLLEEAAASFGQLLTRVETFKPSALIGDVLEEPIETMKAGMAAIKPGKALQPLLEKYNAFLDSLGEFAPSRLLEPLDSFRQELVSLIQSSASLDILAPLEKVLDELHKLLDSIDLDALLEGLQDYIGKVTSLVGEFPLGKVFSQIDKIEFKISEQLTNLDPDAVANSIFSVINPILAVFDQVDIAPISLQAAKLTGLLEQVRVTQIKESLDTGFGGIEASLEQLDVISVVTTLSASWRSVRDALAAVTPDPGDQVHYDNLTALVGNANPATALTPVTASLTGVSGDLVSLREQSGKAMETLAVSFDQTVANIREMFPEPLTTDFLKNTIREAISEAFLEPVKKLLRIIKDRTAGLVDVLRKLEEGFEKFKKALGLILNPLSLLEPIKTALDDFKKTLKAFNLSFLKEEIRASAAVVAGKLDAFDLTALVEPLDVIFEGFIEQLRTLFSTDIIASLDSIYDEKIGGVVEKLEPEVLLAPLDLLFKDVLAALEPFSVEVLLKPVREKMEALSEELVSGLQRTGQAFGLMLNAIPV